MTAKRTLAAFFVLAGIAASASSLEAGNFQKFIGKSCVSVNFGGGGIRYQQWPSAELSATKLPSDLPAPSSSLSLLRLLSQLPYHWVFYGQYNSRFAASQAEQHLRYQGKRTYVKVKHIISNPGGGYPFP